NVVNLSSMGVVKVTVSGDKVTDAEMVTKGEPYYQKVSVSATKQTDTGNLSFNGEIEATDTMLTFAGNKITLEVDAIKNHLIGNSLFDDILDGFLNDAHYIYRINLQHVAGPSPVVIGHLDDADDIFTAFPRQNCS